MNELYHHGIIGQKWGIRRTPEQLGHVTKKKDVIDLSYPLYNRRTSKNPLHRTISYDETALKERAKSGRFGDDRTIQERLYDRKMKIDFGKQAVNSTIRNYYEAEYDAHGKQLSKSMKGIFDSSQSMTREKVVNRMIQGEKWANWMARDYPGYKDWAWYSGQNTYDQLLREYSN